MTGALALIALRRGLRHWTVSTPGHALAIAGVPANDGSIPPLSSADERDATVPGETPPISESRSEAPPNDG